MLKNNSFKSFALKQMRRCRGFVFTSDALLALALVSAVVAFFAFASLPAPRNEKFFELEQLGFDALALEHNETLSIAVSPEDFSALTGFQRFDSAAAAQASGAAMVARARFYDYPALCGCASFPCGLDRDAECLYAADLFLGGNYSEVWVTP